MNAVKCRAKMRIVRDAYISATSEKVAYRQKWRLRSKRWIIFCIMSACLLFSSFLQYITPLGLRNTGSPRIYELPSRITRLASVILQI